MFSGSWAFQASVVVVFWSLLFRFARGYGRFWGGVVVRTLVKRVPGRYGRFWRVFHARHFANGQNAKMVHYQANRSCFVGVPCKMLPRLGDFMALVVFLAASFRFARGYGPFWMGFAVRTLVNRVPGRYGRVWRAWDGRHFENGKNAKMVIYQANRSCFVGVPCKMAPGLRDFMVLVFGVSWSVFLSGRRRYGRFWPFACPGVSWGVFLSGRRR